MTTVYKKIDETAEDMWKKIEAANKLIATIDIRGKDYAQVHQRVKAFRYVYPKGQIKTEIVNISGEVGSRICLMRCQVYDDLGNLIATGTAEEKEGSNFINNYSFIENCETSCCGRALANAGFGIDVSFASYEEVANVDKQGDEVKKLTSRQLSDFTLAYTEEERKNIRKKENVKSDEDLPRDVAKELIKKRKEKVKTAQEKIAREYKEKPFLSKDDPNPFY